MDCSCPQDFAGKNTGVGCSLLPGDSYAGLFLEASFPNPISREKSYDGNVKCILGFLSGPRRKD